MDVTRGAEKDAPLRNDAKEKARVPWGELHGVEFQGLVTSLRGSVSEEGVCRPTTQQATEVACVERGVGGGGVQGTRVVCGAAASKAAANPTLLCVDPYRTESDDDEEAIPALPHPALAEEKAGAAAAVCEEGGGFSPGEVSKKQLLGGAAGLGSGMGQGEPLKPST